MKSTNNTLRVFLLTCCSVLCGQVIGQEDGTRTKARQCDELIYSARDMFNTGELKDIIALLEPCLTNDEITLRQRRTMFRLLAESHLFLKDYLAASEYAKALAVMDPGLQVFGIPHLGIRHNKLHHAIKAFEDTDAPDLLLMIGNIRYRAWGFDVVGGLSSENISLKEERMAEGVTAITGQKWQKAYRGNFGIGIKYDSYQFPISVSFRLNRTDVIFKYREEQELNGLPATITFKEKQKWLSPELWFGYQFAPKTFPVKKIDVALRAGFGMDILTGTTLEEAWLTRMTEVQWYGGEDQDITDMISQKIYPVALAAIAAEYRFGMASVFCELQYRHPFMDNYVFDIPTAPYASSVRNVHTVGLHGGVRFMFYKAFYK